MKAIKPVSHLLSNSFTLKKMKKIWTSYCHLHLKFTLTVPRKPITAMFHTNQTCHCKRSVIKQFLQELHFAGYQTVNCPLKDTASVFHSPKRGRVED